MSIVFDTPGEIDIRAFTTFGLHAKPNSTNPIGRFGSGLKNAVAVLVREGIKVSVFIGTTEYEFYCSDTEFRDQQFKLIRMRKRNILLKRWRYEDLPFTTNHAAHWELWQAFRELHSNTLDEGGTTEFAAVIPDRVAGRTLIVVSGPKFEAEFFDRDKTFLPGALTKREGDQSVEVFNEPSKHIYWRGVRVFDLENPSVYTYNILDNMTLTEDRTLKHVWEAQSKIASYVARSKDKKLIHSAVSADAEKFFEGRLDFDYAYVSPSTEFKEVLTAKKSRGRYIAPRALAYADRYIEPPAPKPAVSLEEQIRAWSNYSSVPEELRKLLKHLLTCEIKEPKPTDDVDMPF